MSVHSAMSPQNPNFNNSHLNNPADSMEAHSVQADPPQIHPDHRQWVAAYIDGQYYLTDPESMQRLRNIEAEIQQQRSKLAKLQTDNNSLHNSFLSLQEDRNQKLSSKSFCPTQFNENKQINKEQKVKNQLQKEQDKYKEKIKRMERQRSQMKKVMKPASRREPSAKEVGQTGSKQANPQEPVLSEVQKQRKSARKSARLDSRQKSYRKSRIQQSIKDNIENQIDLNLVASTPIQDQKSAKPPSAANREGFSEAQVDPPKSERKSVKQSVKYQKVVESTPSGLGHSVKPFENQTAKPSKQNQLSLSAKNVPCEKQLEQKSENKTFRASSHKPETPEAKVEEAANSSNYKVLINPVGSVHSSLIEPRSSRHQQFLEKQAQKSQAAREPSHKNEELKSRTSRAEERSIHSKKTTNNGEIRQATNLKEQTQSRKTSGLKEEIQSSKSVKDNEKEFKSRKESSYKEETKSKHSQIVVQAVTKQQSYQKVDKSVKSHISNVEQKAKSSRATSFKKQDSFHPEIDASKSKKSHVVEQIRSRKSSLNKKDQESLKVSQKGTVVMDKSVQYSRVTEVHKESHVNSINFQNVSEKNSSFIQHHQESMNESSHSKLEMLNKQLAEEEVQKLESSNIESYNMKKKKSDSVYDNQSQKKSRSFIIHSRNGSVKERTEKSYDKMKKSKLSEKKSQKPSEIPSNHSNNAESVSKQELFKLHEQIAILKEKLRKVEERQQQMQKMDSNLSKINKNESEVPNEEQEFNESLPQTPVSPEVRLSQLSLGLRPPGRLHLQSSIIQVNTNEQAQKKLEKEAEALEKVKLNQEISRLKKIIRDMQIEKIKSIDQDNEFESSTLLKKDSINLSHRGSRVQKIKESINVEGMATQKKPWSKSRIQEVGRIIKNSYAEYDKEEMSPRRRSQNIKFYGNDDQVVIDSNDIPLQSAQKSPNKLIRGAKQASMIEKLQEKDRDFHHFIESSRILVEGEIRREPTDEGNQPKPSSFQQFSKISSHGFPEASNKINYSRMVQEFKKNNPEEEQLLPQIHLRDIKVPELPNVPTADMNQDDLLALAKKTYQGFGIDVDTEDKQLCVKKYKNCVVFTLTNNTSECILWHFSGKFYMGGWRSGQPGQGQKHGEGIQIIPEKYIYKGQFLNGKKNGTGILKLANGNIYDGQWIDGLKNGRGVYLDTATRVIYSGEWKEGKKDGQGYLKLSDKEYYYGTFVKSVKEGYGTEVFVNGDKYKGQYKNGKFHGKGKYLWANGSCYQGQFQEGVRQGQGSWKSAKINGDIYIGTYEGDKKNGYGRYVWANGCMYEGGFANDVKHGKGRLTYQDGKEVKGVWEDGNLIKTENQKAVSGDHEEQPLRRSVKVNSFGGYHPATRNRF